MNSAATNNFKVDGCGMILHVREHIEPSLVEVGCSYPHQSYSGCKIPNMCIVNASVIRQPLFSEREVELSPTFWKSISSVPSSSFTTATIHLHRPGIKMVREPSPSQLRRRGTLPVHLPSYASACSGFEPQNPARQPSFLRQQATTTYATQVCVHVVVNSHRGKLTLAPVTATSCRWSACWATATPAWILRSCPAR